MIRRAAISDAPAIAHVHVETWQTAYTGIMPAEFLAGLSRDEKEAMWTKELADLESKTHIYVAEVGSMVVGFACGGPLRESVADFDGELYAIYVLKQCQGLGLGKQLFDAVAHDLIARDFQSMLLWALQENSACHFYETMGGKPITGKTVEIGGKALQKVAYGFFALRFLYANTARAAIR